MSDRSSENQIDVYKWIITMLLAALTSVVWYLLIDTRDHLNTLEKIVMDHTIEISVLKTK